MGKPKLPWFPLYVYDWITDEAVQCMTLEQQGAYLRLLMHQWIEGSIPRNEDEIARLLNVPRDSVASLMAPIWQKFPKVKYKRGRHANPTLESIREEQESRRKTKADNGLKGARQRWQGHSPANGGPMPTRAITNTITIPITKARNSTPDTSTRPRSRDVDIVALNEANKLRRTIQEIYQCYPRQVGRTAALRAIQKALTRIAKSGKESDPADYLKRKVEAFADSAAGQAGKFTPYPATWMNAGRYDDAVEEWQEQEPERKPVAGHDPDWERKLLTKEPNE